MAKLNICEKILAAASSRREVRPGEIVEAKVDMAMVNEITGPLAIEAFGKIGVGKVWDNHRVIMVLDHQVPADSVNSAELHKIMRKFAIEQGIQYLYDVGKGGICHQIMVEKGHVRPGELIIGADSHTCTCGALGAFGTGVGSTEIAAVFATGRIWLKVPETIRFNVYGELQKFVTPKDLILKIIGMVGVDGAIYKAMEFDGPAINRLDVGERMTICNMAVEAGAKTGIINPDEKAITYVKERTNKSFKPLKSDADANYEELIDVEADKLEPQIACPHSVDNVRPVSEVEGTPIQQAFIGSCTNGRIEDLRLAARFLKGKKVKEGVRLIITPASQEVYLEALKEDLLETFVEAGACVCNPTCGACFGGHMGLLADGETCISASNRNFIGRMGSKRAQIFLASPATVAASAVMGVITDPRRCL
jgi:3-isopropylmalate/(R)-2-methylmalate dehydratase large subunit